MTIHGRFWCEASGVGNSFETGGSSKKRAEIWTETQQNVPPSKIEWDRIPTDPVKSKLQARAIRYSGLGVFSVGPVGDFLESQNSGFFFP